MHHVGPVGHKISSVIAVWTHQPAQYRDLVLWLTRDNCRHRTQAVPPNALLGTQTFGCWCRSLYPNLGPHEEVQGQHLFLQLAEDICAVAAEHPVDERRSALHAGRSDVSKEVGKACLGIRPRLCCTTGGILEQAAVERRRKQ